MPGYKLIVKNAKVILKTVTNAVLNISGIKDLLTGDGSVDSNNKINWTLQEYTNTSANFTSINPVLLLGQKGIETDDLLTTPKFKIGDGVTAWNTLPYFSIGGSSGVQSVTGHQVDNTDPNNPIVNPLGLIKIIDKQGDFFNDLATANAYISTFTSATITDESFVDGVYYFTVPSGSDFSNATYFLGNAFVNVSAYIVDEFGLITLFNSNAFDYNDGGNILGEITIFLGGFNSASGVHKIKKITTDYSSFGSSSGRFIIDDSPILTGVTPTDFFVSSTATILTLAANFGNADFAQAASNGANVQYDSINLVTTSVLNAALALKQDISSEQLASLTSTSISTTSSGNTNLTEMNTTVLANTTYTIDGVIRIGCNNTGGVALQVTIPSGTIFLGLNGLTTSSTVAQWLNIPSSATLTGSYCRINTTTGFVYIKGTIEIGATGGDLVWGFASVVNLQTSTVYRLGTQIKITKK